MHDLETRVPPSAGSHARLLRSPWPVALLVALLAFGSFAVRLGNEPHFVDESAYISQSYYAQIYLEGRFNDRAWLDYPAYDLPPVPKYLIGTALAATGHQAPGRAQALAWYLNTSLRFVSDEALRAARLPSVLLGVVGCVALHGIGSIVGGRGVGTLAALLLAVDPLYRMLARRAMSDVPCEAFMLAALWLGLLAWRDWLDGKGRLRGMALTGLAGVCAGLALQCKMSGALCLIILGAWGVLGLVVRPEGRRVDEVAVAGLVVGILAVATSLLVNPFLTAHPAPPLSPAQAALERNGPLGRARMSAALRVRVASEQQTMFPHNATTGPLAKLATTAVQGFGRFGPLGPAHADSTRRYDLDQDWGAMVWLPLVAIGLGAALAAGRRESSSGAAPLGWAVAVQFLVTLGVVAAYLPMAWDRYFLSLQAPSALLVSIAAAGPVARLARRRKTTTAID